MSRRVQRVPYQLDGRGVVGLTAVEVRAILRAADDLVGRGGRTLLSKILKGSRAREVLDLGLDQNPSYGFYRDLSPEQVLARIDWMILQGYLEVEYDYRLPLLVYTDRGWEIERETVVGELFAGFEAMAGSSAKSLDMLYLKDRDRGMILMLLDRVAASGDRRFIPILEAWEQVDYAKVRERIRQVVRQIELPKG